MKKYLKISIIIPLYIINERFFDDLKKFEKLNYPDFEILIVCDKNIQNQLPKSKRVRFIKTHKARTGPAEKRDIAISKAKGQICAFIDDDAYPDKNWLINSLEHFKHPKIVAVGGPGLTPPEDTYWEQLTGLVYRSYFCGGAAQYRFVKGKMQFVEDYPAYNLIIKKDVLQKVGGYGSHFYGGEDTFLCLKIIKKGYKILYDPQVAVFHHRRPLFLPYLKQIANIGRHRGYFVIKFPETSLQVMYFIPLFLTLALAALGAGALLDMYPRIIFIWLMGFAFLLGFLSVIRKSGNVVDSSIASVGLILTHVIYGINFVRGLMTRNLER